MDNDATKLNKLQFKKHLKFIGLGSDMEKRKQEFTSSAAKKVKFEQVEQVDEEEDLESMDFNDSI